MTENEGASTPKRDKEREPQRATPQPQPAKDQVQKDHPASKIADKFRRVSQMVKARAAGQSEHQRAAEILRTLADACEDAGKYVSERGVGFDDKPAAKGTSYDANAVKVMRFEMRELLEQVRGDTQTNATLIASQRANRPTALSPELELLIRQIISALLSRFFGGMRFEGEDVDDDAGRIVTKPEPRRARSGPGTRAAAQGPRHLTR